MIEKLNDQNLTACVAMAMRLWPEATEKELLDDFTGTIHSDDWIILLYRSDEGNYTGFIMLSIRRDHVEGSHHSPVAYIEGIYVEESYRRKRMAGELVQAAEHWAREKGSTQIGSDCEWDNDTSYRFHTAIGFTEANRIICFIKDI